MSNVLPRFFRDTVDNELDGNKKVLGIFLDLRKG